MGEAFLVHEYINTDPSRMGFNVDMSNGPTAALRTSYTYSMDTGGRISSVEFEVVGVYYGSNWNSDIIVKHKVGDTFVLNQGSTMYLSSPQSTSVWQYAYLSISGNSIVFTQVCNNLWGSGNQITWSAHFEANVTVYRVCY